MPIGWFNRNADGSPDLSSVTPAGKKALYKILATQPGANTQTQVDYTIVDLEDGELQLLREQIKGSALFDDTKWDAFTAAQKSEFVRTAIQKIVKFIFRGTP